MKRFGEAQELNGAIHFVVMPLNLLLELYCPLTEALVLSVGFNLFL